MTREEAYNMLINDIQKDIDKQIELTCRRGEDQVVLHISNGYLSLVKELYNTFTITELTKWQDKTALKFYWGKNNV